MRIASLPEKSFSRGISARAARETEQPERENILAPEVSVMRQEE